MNIAKQRLHSYNFKVYFYNFDISHSFRKHSMSNLSLALCFTIFRVGFIRFGLFNNRPTGAALWATVLDLAYKTCRGTLPHIFKL